MLYLKNSLCTIDVSIPEYQYLSQSLTLEECRQLYASLHFTTFDLPLISEKNVPHIPCIQLLTKWDKGTNKREGKSKSHVDVVLRLRQLGRDDLAEWLSDAVYKRLVRDVNDALDTRFSNKTESVQRKIDRGERVTDDWTIYNTVMWAVLAGLGISLLLIIGRIIAICCKKRLSRKKVKEEEIMDLLSYGSLDSDQETIYECAIKTNRVKK